MSHHIPLTGLFDDSVRLPSGMIVPKHTAEDLIKSEAKKQRQEENKAQFFSRFALAQNMISYGAREKPQGTPIIPILYEASEKSFVDAILIRARCNQMKRIWQLANTGKAKEVGYRVVHERHDDKDYKVTKNDNERCREMQALLSDPTPLKFTYLYPHQVRPHTRLKDFVTVMTKAELIIDRKVMLRYKRRDGQGYAAFHWLPGETIKPVDEALRAWAKKHESDGRVAKHSIEKMSYMTGFDIGRSAYVQMVDGMIVGAYSDDEISLHISNPSDRLNRYGYGVSMLEMSLDVTAALLMAWTYNKEMFKTNYPEAILTVAGDFDKEGLMAFKQQILSEAGGIGSNWRLPVIPAGDVENFKVESHKLRDTPKDMLFDTMFRMLVMFKAASYGAHPSTLNLDMDSGSGGATLSSPDPASEIEFSKEQGIVPMITDMAEWITDSIVKPRYDDLKIIITGMNPEDEKQTIDLRTQRTSKWMTRNEARMEEGMEPVGDMEDETNMWNMPADAPLMNQMTQFNMMQQQQEQGNNTSEEDDQQGYENQQDDDQYYKSLNKSAKEIKFLRIDLEDQL